MKKILKFCLKDCICRSYLRELICKEGKEQNKLKHCFCIRRIFINLSHGCKKQKRKILKARKSQISILFNYLWRNEYQVMSHYSPCSFLKKYTVFGEEKSRVEEIIKKHLLCDISILMLNIFYKIFFDRKFLSLNHVSQLNLSFSHEKVILTLIFGYKYI